jgi:hypothetical protein
VLALGQTGPSDPPNRLCNPPRPAAEGVASAAAQLYTVERLLLGPTGGAHGAGAVSASVRSQLLATVAEVLLDGSTPPVAAPFFGSLFERALGSGAVQLDLEAKVGREFLLFPFLFEQYIHVPVPLPL